MAVKDIQASLDKLKASATKEHDASVAIITLLQGNNTLLAAALAKITELVNAGADPAEVAAAVADAEALNTAIGNDAQAMTDAALTGTNPPPTP